MNDYDFLVSDISSIKGIGTKTTKLFKKKNINTVFDLLWSLPRDFIDRGDLRKINELQVGKIQTISIKVLKYNFPRIRNLPNKVICSENNRKINLIFFPNSSFTSSALTGLTFVDMFALGIERG